MYSRAVNSSLITQTGLAYNANNFLKVHSVTDEHISATDNSRQSLLQLIRQHQHQQGWILLVAPSHIPDKVWAEQYQLSLHNVLVVHQKQIHDLAATLQQALNSPSCKVVINCASQLDIQQLSSCRNLALKNNTWFYQVEPRWATQVKH